MSSTLGQATPFHPYELGVPLWAPPFFDAVSSLEWAFLNDFGAEAQAEGHSYKGQAPSTPYGAASSAVSDTVIQGSLAIDKKPPNLTRCQRKNIKKRAKRLESRTRAQETAGTSLKACSLRHRSAAMAVNLTPQHNLEEQLPSKPAWIGKRECEQDLTTYGLEEIMDSHGMTLIKWDGRETRPLIDCNRRIFGVLGGMPKAQDWDDVQKAAALGIEEARPQLTTSQKDLYHRRGDFPSFAVGISYGGGQSYPGILNNGKHNTPILNELIQMPAFKRISGFTNCLFEAFSPRLYSYYQKMLAALNQWSPESMERLYPKTAFAAASINFGPQTVSYPHRDYANLSWGWCAITALGSYDPDHGGHLVLWDLKYVIQFPPGATILIPSAMIKHSNTPVQMNETRYSFVQYSAGGLFRWMDNGFMSDIAWYERATAQQIQQREEAQKLRWHKGLGMLSLCDEF